MSRLKIKNFGPVKEGLKETLPDGSVNEWLEVKKVTVFIGNQGSGKSVVAKLISTFSWIEKALIRGDYDIRYFTNYNRFRKTICAYHRLENYFFDEAGNDVANLAYEGDAYAMFYTDGKLVIEEMKKGGYLLPQIMYVPAERNFITYLKTTEKRSSVFFEELLELFWSHSFFFSKVGYLYEVGHFLDSFEEKVPRYLTFPAPQPTNLLYIGVACDSRLKFIKISSYEIT